MHLEKYPVIKVRFSKGFVFACVQAANEFEEQRARFFSENEVKDDYMEVCNTTSMARALRLKAFATRVFAFGSKRRFGERTHVGVKESETLRANSQKSHAKAKLFFENT